MGKKASKTASVWATLWNRDSGLRTATIATVGDGNALILSLPGGDLSLQLDRDRLVIDGMLLEASSDRGTVKAQRIFIKNVPCKGRAKQ